MQWLYAILIIFAVSVLFLIPHKTPLTTIPHEPELAQSLYSIKGIWTSFWGNPNYTVTTARFAQNEVWGPRNSDITRQFSRDEIANNGTGSVAVNAVWMEWDVNMKQPPCGANEQEYAGECFAVNPIVDDEIKFYSEKNIDVYAILYGTPERFRIP